MEETVHQDTGLLGFTTKHRYFSGAKKKFRVRYDKVVDFEPFSDGFEIMRASPDGEAPSLQDRGPLVRLRPGHEPGADVVAPLTPSWETAPPRFEVRFSMKLWPFRKQKNAPAGTGPAATPAPANTTAGTKPTGPVTIVPFPGDIEDTATLKYHGIRALGAFMMERHSACRQQHPFCGPHGHLKNGDARRELVAHVIPQTTESGDDLIAIYLCRAEGGIASTDGETVDPFEYTAWLNCIEPESRRKLVAQLQSDGSYLLHYGPVLNPVKDDHSTGRIDTSRSWYSTGNPEPPGVKWEYREIEIADGKLRLISSFRCLQVFGEWWVVDTDGEKRAYQQIAAFDYADNPNHDLGTV